MFLSFLRFALDDNCPVPDDIGQMDWDALLEFGRQHTIVGVLYHGLKKLEQHPKRPDKYKIIEWFSANEEIVRENERVNQAAARVTYLLYKKEGIKACVLKGQGNALMYPDPMMRTSGDIDLWTNLSTDDLLRYIMRVSPDSGIEYHHIDFPVYDDVVVEIHITPSFMGNLFYERRLRRYFEEVKKEQFRSIVSLPGNAGNICVPTDDFNRIFQLSHVMHHFFFEGVGLRQIIDYYYLLRKGFTEEERLADVKLLKRLNMTKFAAAMMWVLHEQLGLERRYLLVEPNENVGRMLFDEIMKAGNFGRSDDRYAFQGRSVYTQYFIEIYRNLHYAWQFPSETLWGRPLSRWWHMFYKWRLRRKAKKMLTTQ